MKFSGSISDVNINNSAKIGELSMPGNAHQKIKFWGILDVLYRSDKFCEFFLDLVPPYGYQHLSNIS